jgi:2-haloacid dehalogenase
VQRICVFDVNETLLDLAALDPHFERIFGDASIRKSWFMQMLQSALVATVTDRYSPFGTIGIAALEMLAAQKRIAVTEADRQAIREGMKHLPAHPEVRESLARLKGGGVRLAALTNSTAEVAEAQLHNAGLAEYFERILSAEAVRRLKPAPEPYHMAADRLGVHISGIRLIAAHAWDIAGALRAGCAAAFVARPGMVLDPLVEVPDLIGADLREITDHILALPAPTLDT